MQELRREELTELKKFFVEIKWVDGLFQVLFLLEDAKPGVYLQQQDEKRKQLKQLRNILCWFGLFVSMRHGGYATKNKTLYKKWNKIFGFKLDAVKFLGYPSCCVEARKSGPGSATIAIQLYLLIKEIKYGNKSMAELKKFVTNQHFLHHVQCKNECVESINLERKFETVMDEYSWLVGELVPAYYRQKIDGLIQNLELLSELLIPKKDKLADKALLLKFELNPTDIKEISNNAEEFKENIDFGKRILESL